MVVGGKQVSLDRHQKLTHADLLGRPSLPEEDISRAAPSLGVLSSSSFLPRQPRSHQALGLDSDNGTSSSSSSEGGNPAHPPNRMR